MHLFTPAVVFFALLSHAAACCALTSGSRFVVNADQTVIMLWDEARQTQHFIRQANFKTDAADVGFIVPSPSRPQLAESGNEAFPRLKEITAPRVNYGGGFGLGCSTIQTNSMSFGSVRVIEEKRVAGFDATVLTARSGADLVAWLKAHGYAYSPAAAEWAAPYLGGDWHFTALKVAKDANGVASQDLKAGALRITFRTSRPLFPYREPESAAAAGQLNAPPRLLRIYFIAEARYRGEIEGGYNWSGKAVWSGDITPHREALLQDLRLSAGTGPAQWWLTEFEDRWPYAEAPGDVYFQRDSSQRTLRRKDITSAGQQDAVFIAMLATGCVLPLRRRR